jgi:ribose transport system permease protein
MTQITTAPEVDERSDQADAVPTARRRFLEPSMVTRTGVVWGLIVIVIVAWLVYPGFLNASNLRVVLIQTVPVGLVAVGMTFLMLSGAFDLSAGPTLGLGAVLYAQLSNSMPLAEAAVLTLLAGVAIGVVNGLITTKLRVNSFVATLGTASIVTGVGFLYTKANPVTAENPSFGGLGNDNWLGVPVAAWLLLAVLIVSGLVLYYTKLGRSIYAIGGNPEASRLCGIRVDTMRILCYVLVGVFAAAGGMVLASQLSTVQAGLGADYSLNAIAIVIIGGTSLLGGEGAMWRTAVGMLILATISNVLDAKAVDSNWQSIVTGVVLILAVALDVLGRRLEARRGRRAPTA